MKLDEADPWNHRLVVISGLVKFCPTRSINWTRRRWA